MATDEQRLAGVVTVLVADVQWPAGLREREPDMVSAVMAGLEAVVGEAIAAHGGIPLAADRNGARFAAAFQLSPEAVACAAVLQRARTDPPWLRVCVHAGEALSGDGTDHAAPAVSGAGRLLEVAHGGQALLSGTVADLVAGRLPDGAWLVDLGSHRLADLAPAVRVWQLCQPDVGMEFPALRSLNAFAHNLPVQLTSFTGRGAEMDEVRRILSGNRMVTLTGAGGAGKTRLALQVAARMLGGFAAGAWLVDLAPLTDPSLVEVAVARALGLPDEEPGATMATITGFIAAERALIVLDNCEHLLDACASLAEELLRACPALVILATSREPVGAAGELTWRIPSLSTSEAMDLLTERARRARPGFAVTADNAEAVEEICRRLDGIPLALELAAARLRAFSPGEIATGLHDRFRLLTGGSRTAVRRQQTLRASVDWSHALLTEPERVLFRRLAAFAGGFDLDAGLAVGAGDGLQRHHVLDQLALLIDKSLVAADESQAATRYRLLETVRQYAAEKLAESGEADRVRTRHRDYYIALASRLDPPADGETRRLIQLIEAEIDNLRAAYQWSMEVSDTETALRLASSLQPMWLGRSRALEGHLWFEAALARQSPDAQAVAPAVWVRAVADAALLFSWTIASAIGPSTSRTGAPPIARAEEAVALARQLGDPALLGRALLGACCAVGYISEAGRQYLDEATLLARQAADDWTLGFNLGGQAYRAVIAGYPAVARSAAEEGLALAEQTANDHASRQCRYWLSFALIMQGDLHRAKSMCSDLIAEAEAERAPLWKSISLALLGSVLAIMCQPEEARAAGEASIAIADSLGVAGSSTVGYWCLSLAAMASGDLEALLGAIEMVGQRLNFEVEFSHQYHILKAEASLAAGDLPAAREHADKALTIGTTLAAKSGQPSLDVAAALEISARVAAAAGEAGRAHDEAYQALTVARDHGAQLGIIAPLETLSGLPQSADDHHKAARMVGAADALRQKTGAKRFLLHQDRYDSTVIALRSSMGDAAFDQAWDEGAAMSLDEVITYALRGRGQRGRPAMGWLSLTPAERDVARLVAEGLANKDIAARLFVSPRTVQTHLTHMYGKLGITSRVQLAKEAARHC